MQASSSMVSASIELIIGGKEKRSTSSGLEEAMERERKGKGKGKGRGKERERSKDRQTEGWQVAHHPQLRYRKMQR